MKPTYERQIRLTDTLSIPTKEIQWSAMRAQGAGGQNVNKVSTAVQLRFDIMASSLPERYKFALLSLPDQRISQGGIVIIKAQLHRSQDRNREAAIARLAQLVRRALVHRKARIATKPSRAAKRARLEGKIRRGRLKALRGKVIE